MANLIDVKVPDIGDFKDVPIIEVLVQSGDRVKAEDPLITLESDKASMEVPSPAVGIVKNVVVKLGDKVRRHTNSDAGGRWRAYQERTGKACGIGASGADQRAGGGGGLGG